MKWFGEARFGMFIHWGVYSVPAGEYARWPITIREPGEYEVTAELSCEAVGTLTVEVSDQTDHEFSGYQVLS
jgi:hypothetical protein